MGIWTGQTAHFRARTKRYFTLLHQEVAASNLERLRQTSLVFALFLLSYGLVFFGLFHNYVLVLCYLVFFGLDLAFLLFAHLYRPPEPSYPLVQAASVLFIFLAVGFTACISIFPFPERPGIFYPLSYMLMTVIFTLPFWLISLTLTFATIVYLAVAALVKAPAALAYDVAGAVTTWILGFFFLYWIIDLRLRDGETKLELERISRTDLLTGLPNRRAMEEDMTRTYRRCQKAKLPVAAAMLDADDFKQINDTCGHPEGDCILRELGKLLWMFTEEQGISVARYGGEEFVMLLSGSTEEEAVLCINELLDRLHQSGLQTTDGRMVTLSVGVAGEIPPKDGSLTALIQRADQALYRAKRAGKDCVVGERL